MIAALTRRRSPSDLSIAREQRFYAGIFLLPTVLIALGLVAYPLIYSLLLTVRGEGDLPGALRRHPGNALHPGRDPCLEDLPPAGHHVSGRPAVSAAGDLARGPHRRRGDAEALSLCRAPAPSTDDRRGGHHRIADHAAAV